MTTVRRVPLLVVALTAVVALSSCSSEEPGPRDAGSGDGSGYGVPSK